MGKRNITGKKRSAEQTEAKEEDQHVKKAAKSTNESDVPAKDEVKPAVEKKPGELYLERMTEVMDRQGAVGYELIRGVKCRSDDVEDEEKNVKKDDGNEKKDDKGKKSKNDTVQECTPEELSQLRFMLYTDRRRKCLEKARVKILQDQADDNIMMFNTSYSYHIFDLIPREIKNIDGKKTLAEKFDQFYAFTHILFRYDVWMEDNEDWDESARLVQKIAKNGRRC
jgi:hypothetical protein